MTLVQKLRAQLKRVARDQNEKWCGDSLDNDALWFTCKFERPYGLGPLCQSDRMSILTAAIRAAVVTRLADGSRP